MRLRVILEPSEEGGYTALVPSLPGCISEGETQLSRYDLSYLQTISAFGFK